MTVNWFDQALSTRTLVSSVKAFSRGFRCAFCATMLRQAKRAGERLLDEVADPPRPPLLVGVVVEFAADRDRVERLAVGGREDLRVDDVGAGDGAGPGDDRQQARMVGREHGDFGDAPRRRGR